VGTQQARASARLSSGYRINSAADDAAGLAIAQGMKAQIQGMNQAARNAQDGLSLIQTAEGYLQTLGDMTRRMRVLAVQASNDTNSADQRNIIGKELELIQEEMVRILKHATFNGVEIFTNAGGTALLASTFNLQVGPDAGHVIGVEVAVASLVSKISGGFTGAGSVQGLDHAGWQSIITQMDNWLDEISQLQADLGAYMNMLEFTIQNLNISAENMSAAESRIRDADMAAEMMKLSQANILQQAATAMLAQANQAQQSILQLLG
jgi:flagellin